MGIRNGALVQDSIEPIDDHSREDEICLGVSVGGWKYDLLEFGR
jgi:hypothetical protein